MKLILACILLLTASLAAAQSTVPDPAGTASPEGPALLQQFGATFERINSRREEAVETEEYVLQGETAENWTQMLTYQRVSTAEPIAADQYVALLKRHLQESPHVPRFRVVQQSKAAALFGVHYPPAASAGEQLGVVLVTVPDPKRPNEIHLIQFAVSPTRMSPAELELQVKRWQARFQSQAAAFAR